MCIPNKHLFTGISEYFRWSDWLLLDGTIYSRSSNHGKWQSAKSLFPKSDPPNLTYCRSSDMPAAVRRRAVDTFITTAAAFAMWRPVLFQRNSSRGSQSTAVTRSRRHHTPSWVQPSGRFQDEAALVTRRTTRTDSPRLFECAAPPLTLSAVG